MIDSENKDFLAIYVTKSLIDGKEPYYQENFSLIKASSLEEAKQKAPQLVEVETTYKNANGETITWNLETLNIVPTLDDINHNDDEVIDLYVRGFEDFQAYQKLYKSK